MKPLEAELAQYRYQSIPEVPTFTGKSIRHALSDAFRLIFFYGYRWSYRIRHVRLYPAL
jgi:hypothetical protein